MRLRSLFVVTLTSLFFSSRPASAQQAAVQQPIVGAFQVNTAVSVPDRGSASLGGVRSAASGQATFGPVPSGSSFGFTRDTSSASVHVFIHDFQAMDEALLAAARSPRGSRSHVDPQIVDRLERQGRSEDVPPDHVASDIDLAVQAERLAEQAAARGKFAVAKLHWQRAARHGSSRAEAHLAELDRAVAKRR